MLHRHAKGGAGVAALAVFEGEVAAEGAFAVVTGETGHIAGGDEVFCGARGADLASLCGAGGEFVTVSTGEALTSAVFGVAEGVTIRARAGGCWSI